MLQFFWVVDRPTESWISHRRVPIVWKAEIYQTQIVVQDLRVLQTAPSPIFIDAALVDGLRLTHLLTQVVQLRRCERRVAVSLEQSVTW